MQGDVLQAFLELEDIICHDDELSQLCFAHLSLSDQTGPGMWLQLLPPYVSTVQWDVGPVDAVRIIVSDSLIYRVQLLFPVVKTVETGFLKLEADSLKTMLNILLPSSGYAFCPGIPQKDYDDMFSVIRYDPKHLRKTVVGNQERINADTCNVWFQSTPGFTLLEDHTLSSPMCSPCKKLYKRLKDAAQSAVLLTPEEKSKRVKPQSNFPVAHLSPASQKLKKQLKRSEKHILVKKLNFAQQKASESADCSCLYTKCIG
jgi:hypothetical protein